MEKSEKTKDFIDFDTVEKAEQYLKALKDSLSEGKSEPALDISNNLMTNSAMSTLTTYTFYFTDASVYVIPAVPPVPMPYTQNYTVDLDINGAEVTTAYATGALAGVQWDFIRDDGTYITITDSHGYITPKCLMLCKVGLSINIISRPLYKSKGADLLLYKEF